MKFSKIILIPFVIFLVAAFSFFSGTQYSRFTKPNIPQAESEATQTARAAVPVPQPELLPKEGTVTRIIDGDTVELVGGKVVRFVGANAPEVNQPFHDEAAAFTKKLILNKKVALEYEKGYEQDKFGRLLAYVFVGGKNMSIELVKAGLAKVSIYEKRRKLVYQDQLLQAQLEAQKKKASVWDVMVIGQ